MIRNIIFDMGGVLKYFNPPKLIAKYTDDPAETKLLLREVFKEKEWILLDEGTITEEEAIERITKRLPASLHQAAQSLILSWWKEDFDDVQGMDDLIASLHEHGYHIYLLSNASIRQAEYADRLPGARFFEGRITSAEVNLLKPDLRIYELIKEKYDLKAEECLFIDDSAANVCAAQRAGMEGIVFHDDLDHFRKQLKEKGIRFE